MRSRRRRASHSVLHRLRRLMGVGTDDEDATLGAVLRELAGPVDWRVVPAPHCRTTWQELRDWVQWLKDRYALDYRAVPPCWYLHPALVEVLTALRDHHRWAFDPMQLPSAATEWHRVFRDLEPRLRDWASRTGCGREVHRPDVGIAWPDDAERWEAHVADDERQRAAVEESER